MENQQIQKRFNSNRFVLMLDSFISVITSIAAILYVRWQTEPVPGFEKYFLIWTLLALGASIIGFLITGTYKILIRHSSVRSISKLIYAAFGRTLVGGQRR